VAALARQVDVQQHQVGPVLLGRLLARQAQDPLRLLGVGGHLQVVADLRLPQHLAGEPRVGGVVLHQQDAGGAALGRVVGR
jgi:hypothetical protein